MLVDILKCRKNTKLLSRFRSCCVDGWMDGWSDAWQWIATDGRTDRAHIACSHSVSQRVLSVLRLQWCSQTTGQVALPVIVPYGLSVSTALAVLFIHKIPSARVVERASDDTCS